MFSRYEGAHRYCRYGGAHRCCRYSRIPGGNLTAVVGATVLTVTFGSAGVSAALNHPPEATVSTIHPEQVSYLSRYAATQVSRSLQRARLAPNSVEILPVPAVADPSNWQKREDLRVVREEAASKAEALRVAKAAAAKVVAVEAERLAAIAEAERKAKIAAAKVEAEAKIQAAANATKAVERQAAAWRSTSGVSGSSLPPAAGIKAIKAWTAQQVTAMGYKPDQFTCVDLLWTRESGWNVLATNPQSGAYGIPQSLPAAKMASAGKDWRTSARTQISWGLGYINDRYGDPCHAWAHSEEFNWY